MPASFSVNRRNALISASAALNVGVLGKLRAQTVGTTAVTVRLPIAPRLQWDELDGYCGECCIQQAALYFGTYVSQYICRGIINPNQKSQLLVGLNEQQVLSALRLGSVAFAYSRVPSPQFPAYLVWLKQHLSLLRPVLITAYVRGLNDPDYDHIMLATGFTGMDTVNYNPADQLAFNDCFNPLVPAQPRNSATTAGCAPMVPNMNSASQATYATDALSQVFRTHRVWHFRFKFQWQPSANRT